MPNLRASISRTWNPAGRYNARDDNCIEYIVIALSRIWARGLFASCGVTITSKGLANDDRAETYCETEIDGSLPACHLAVMVTSERGPSLSATRYVPTASV